LYTIVFVNSPIFSIAVALVVLFPVPVPLISTQHHALHALPLLFVLFVLYVPFVLFALLLNYLSDI
jgi:hypothetical protein